RRAQRLTGAKTEAGVVPWATHGIAHQNTSGERGAIMCTGSAYSKAGIAAPSHQDRLALGVALQHATVGKLRERDSQRKVGPGQFLFFCHLLNPPGGFRLFGLRQSSMARGRSDRRGDW